MLYESPAFAGLFFARGRRNEAKLQRWEHRHPWKQIQARQHLHPCEKPRLYEQLCQ
jgi:hypothetical protein